MHIHSCEEQKTFNDDAPIQANSLCGIFAGPGEVFKSSIIFGFSDSKLSKSYSCWHFGNFQTHNYSNHTRILQVQEFCAFQAHDVSSVKCSQPLTGRYVTLQVEIEHFMKCNLLWNGNRLEDRIKICWNLISAEWKSNGSRNQDLIKPYFQRTDGVAQFFSWGEVFWYLSISILYIYIYIDIHIFTCKHIQYTHWYITYICTTWQPVKLKT